MSLWRCRTPKLSFPFSLGTFIKHLPISKPKPFYRRRAASVTLTTAAAASSSAVGTGARCSSHLETLSSKQKGQIRLYVDTLLQWNRRMNLTAVKEADEAMERHVEDSLAMLPPLRSSYISYCAAADAPSLDNLKVVDVGTGAGLPGLVLAIACPGWEVTLLESMNKRCVFLEHAVSVIGLSNVEVVRGRAESLGQNVSFRETFDVAVARAVAEMRILEYCLPLVRIGGLFIAAKGHDPHEEVRNAERSIHLMGASVLQLCSAHMDSGLPSYVPKSVLLQGNIPVIQKRFCRNLFDSYAYLRGAMICPHDIKFREVNLMLLLDFKEWVLNRVKSRFE